MKKASVIVLLLGILAGIVGIFWYQELQYLMPTPVPENYTIVKPDQLIEFDTALLSQNHQRPKLLHFFNPECPCSRFNLKHFQSLTREYGNTVDFYVVIDSEEKVAKAKELIDVQTTIIVDENKKLAMVCGVYSTPQAAIIQTSNRLYFRGNYNKSRYCTDKESNFVQMALDSLIDKKGPPVFTELATTSYGCSLPSKQTSFN